jgi:hypothetical protein
LRKSKALVRTGVLLFLLSFLRGVLEKVRVSEWFFCGENVVNVVGWRTLLGVEICATNLNYFFAGPDKQGGWLEHPVGLRFADTNGCSKTVLPG